jgi:MFS family permease
MGQLIAWRAVQGLGAGALEGLSFILVADLFRGARSVAWQSAMAGLMAFSFLGGPLLGGVLCDHLGWQSVFTVNLPIGIAAMVVVARVLPRSLGRSERRDVPPDYAGMVLLTGAIGLTLLGLSRRGMPVPGSDQLRSWMELSTGGALAGGLVLLAAFLFAERSAAAPLLPLRLLRDRTLAVIMITGTAASFAMFASVLLLPRYFQQAGHVSATHSGLLIYPLLIGVLLSVNLGAALMVRTLAFRKVLVGGCALVCIATFDAHTPGWQSSVFMALIGFGVGPTFSGLQIAVQRRVAPADMGAAMGTLILLRQLGGTVALAAAETIYIGRLAGVHTQQAAAGATGTGVFAISLAGALIAIAALASLPRAARRLPELAPG